MYSIMQDGGPTEVCRVLLAIRNYQWWSAMLSERGDPGNPMDVRVSRIIHVLASQVCGTF